MKTIRKLTLIASVSVTLLSQLSYAAESNCSDKIDNDGDGDIDMFDTDCTPASLGFACSGKFYLTRQVTSPSNATVLSTIDFVSGDINISDSKTYSGVLLNASFYYKGQIYAFGHTPSSNVLYQLKNNSTTSTMTITGLPSSSWNNAFCTDDGMVYLLENGSFKLWKVNLKTLAVTSSTITGIPDNASNSIWGDIVRDPTTYELYCWYHPTAASSVRGLYKLDDVNNTFTFMGTNSTNTMGSLFFNSVGQLYGYGSATIGGTQDRFYSINKFTGATTQFGTPDMQVSQTDACNCVTGAIFLPVELVYFTAKLQENKEVQLNWKTASEKNNDYFLVQRSTDAVEWSDLGKVKGNGTTNMPSLYNYTDNAPESGLSYYRLKQVDVNGKETNSPTEVIKNDAAVENGTDKINIYPNPAKDDLWVARENKTNETEILVYDAFGNNVMTVEMEKETQHVDISHLYKGVYMVIVNNKLFRIIKD